MVEAVNDLVAWMEDLRPAWIYASLFTVSFLENVIPPVPGDILVVFGGYLVGVGTLTFVPTVLAATLGGTLGFMALYVVGRRVGAVILDVDRMRWVPKRAARKAVGWLGQYGYAVVAANRFLSGVRSAISLSAGAAHLNPLPTALWATASGVVWCGLMVYLGYIVGDQWQVIGHYLGMYGRWVAVLLFVLAVAYFGRRLWLRARSKGAGEEAAKTP